MKLTVAIVCSKDRLLEKCIKSIPSRTPIIIVLNNTDDYTINICKKYNNIKTYILNERNLGKLRQLAVDKCKTEGILFIDSDCIAGKDLIDKTEKELEECQAINIPLHFDYNNLQTKIVSKCREYTTPDYLLYMPFAFRIELQNTIGKLFNEKLSWGEDTDQRIRLKEHNITYKVLGTFVTHKALTFKEDIKSAVRLGEGTYKQVINNIIKKRNILKDISIIHEIIYAVKCRYNTKSILAGLYHFFIWRPTYKYGYWKEVIKNENKNKNNS